MTNELIILEEKEFYDKDCTIFPTKFDVGVQIFDDIALSDFFSSPNYIADAIEDEIVQSEAFERESLLDVFKSDMEYLKNIYVSPEKYKEKLCDIAIKIMMSIKWVRIGFSNSDKVKQFIESNSTLLQSKNIILPYNIKISDYDLAFKLLEDYKDIKDRIYVAMDNNDSYVKIEDAYEATLKVKEIKDKTLSLNMSPFEQIMFVYDQVRSRRYKQEDETKDDRVSRDLTEVLKNDYIVCLGYANMFSSILSSLDINNKVVNLTSVKDETIGHSRNMVYVKDPKYGVDGVYYFDATFDSKKDDNAYIFNYKHFAKTRNEMDKLDNNLFIYDNCPYYSNNVANEVKEIFNNAEYEKLNGSDLFHSINYMAEFAIGSKVFNRLNFIPISPLYGRFNSKEILDKISYVYEKYDKPISGEAYLKLLNNVRIKENIIDENNYPYSFDAINDTFNKSNWSYSDDYIHSEIEKIKTVLIDKNRK